MKATRVVLVVFGVLVIAFGAYVMVTTVRPNRIVGLATWLLGAVVLHDAILSPFVVGAGLLLRRAGRSLRPWVLVVVQAAVVLGAVLALVVLPEIAAKDHGQKNPTVLPFDYGARLALMEGALLLVVLAVLVVGVLVDRRRASLAASGPGSGQKPVVKATTIR